jgi:hypothetical protein
MLMSSSISGQLIPEPLPMISNLARSSGVASESRQDHANGTLIVRPSTNWAEIVSSVTETQVDYDLDSDLIQFSRRKTIVADQRQRRKPVFPPRVGRN